MRLSTNMVTGPCWRCGKTHTYDRRYPNTVCAACRNELEKRGRTR